MASGDVVPYHEEESALESLLKRAAEHEGLGAVIPRDLLQFGLYGSVLVIVTGLLALMLPSPTSISHGHFFLVLGHAEAGLVGFMQALAVPAIVVGIALLGLDVYLSQVPTGERWRLAVVGQAAIGGVGGCLGVLFLALLVLNIAIWVVLIMLGLAVIGVFFAALAGGG